jgi:YHS domain-containing protein
MATDLVCGMIVNPESAPAKTNYEGKEYSFCATYCKKVFDKNPQKFFQDSKNWSKAIDPVCGMSVPIPLAGAMSVNRDQFIYFCNKRCKEEFDTSPGRYLNITQKMGPYTG